MYCSTCGSEIKAELNYCNRCGAKVDKLEKIGGGDNSRASSYLSITTGFVGLGGLGLTLGLIVILLDNGVIPPVIVMLTLAFLSAVFGICFLMIQQISSMTKTNSGERTDEKTNPAQLGVVVNPIQLEEYRQPATSVTETTTRTLDKDLVR